MEDTGGPIRLVFALGLATLMVVIGVVAGLAVAGIGLGLSLAFTAAPSMVVFVSVLVIAVLGCAASAAWLAARMVVPRVAGRRSRPLSPLRTRLLVAAASMIAAVVAVTVDLGASRAAVAGWLVGIVASGSVGAWIATAAPRTRPFSSPSSGGTGRLRSDQRGSMATEHLAVMLVAALMIAALLAAPLVPSAAAWAAHDACALFGGVCGRPGGPARAEIGPQPTYACERSSASTGAKAAVAAVIGVDRSLDYTIAEYADGTVRLSYANGAALGSGAAIGLQAEVHWGEGGLSLGGQGSVGGAVRVVDGETYEWSGPDAARQARDHQRFHAITSGASDLVLHGGRNGLGGTLLRETAGLVNRARNSVPWVDGLDLAPPERTLVHVGGGTELEASLSGGWPIPVVSDDGTPAVSLGDGSSAAAMSTALGLTTDTATGETTYHVAVSHALEAEMRADRQAVRASWADRSTVSVRVGGGGDPVEAIVTSYRLDEAGADILAATSRRDAFPDRWYGEATASGMALATPSLYQVETRVDLTTDAGRAVLDDVLVGGALYTTGDVASSYAGGWALRAAHEAGQTTIIEHRTSDRAFGGELTGGALLAVGGGGGLRSSDRVADRSYYWDERSGAYQPWTACTT